MYFSDLQKLDLTIGFLVNKVLKIHSFRGGAHTQHFGLKQNLPLINQGDVADQRHVKPAAAAGQRDTCHGSFSELVSQTLVYIPRTQY